jgi:3-keto-5-aminohexanoate cleavage enzyme
MVPRRSDSPFVPLTPAEISEQVLEVAALGITSVHLHARSEDERPTWKRQYFEDIIGRIRASNKELVICVTTSGREEAALERRGEVLDIDGELKPDMASLTLSSMNFAREASVNSPNTVQELARRMMDRGIKPELEVFDTGMVNYLTYLAEKGLLTAPFIVNFILGGPATAQAQLIDLGLLVSKLPTGSVWSAGGIGRQQTSSLALALASGGGVRVGLEDNLFWDDNRTKLASNRELVERVLALGDLLGRQPMTPTEFRSAYLHA